MPALATELDVAMVDWSAIDTLVCDIDGVVVLGRDPIPGVGEALTEIEHSGIAVRFVTNNSTKTRATVAERIYQTVGFETTEASIITSGLATAKFIADTAQAVYVLGSEGLRTTLRQTGIAVTGDWRAADSVVVGLDFKLTFQALADAALAIQHGATFYATNADVSYPTPYGLYPGAGSLVAAVAATTGVDPMVCGKPFQPMQRLLPDFVGRHAVMVGDRPETDIALGKEMGWPTCLVLTGVVADANTVPSRYRADIVLESLAEMPTLLGL